MENIPNEIVCEFFSYITNISDIINITIVNKRFRQLILYCVKEINGDIISVDFVLNLPSIVIVNGTIQVGDTNTLLLLKNHPSLKKFRIQSVWSDNTVENQFWILNELINGKRNLVGLDFSIKFGQDIKYPIEIIGLSNNLLYIRSKPHYKQFPINYSLINRELNKFNTLGIDTLTTDIPYILYPSYKQGHLMSHIHTIHIQLDTVPKHDEELFLSIADLCNIGVLNHVTLTLSRKNMNDDYVKTYCEWMYDCMMGAHGYNTQTPIHLDIPVCLYRNGIDLILNIFPNISSISIMYTPQIELLVQTLNTLLQRHHIQTIKLYSYFHMDLPENYLSNAKIQCVSYRD